MAFRGTAVRIPAALRRLPLRHNTRAYALTARGLALRETIIALARWGAEDG